MQKSKRKKDEIETYMKKEAVKMRPIASVKTESVGYNESGIGLAIAFAAFHNLKKTQNQNVQNKIENEIEWIQRITMIECEDLAPSELEKASAK